MKSEWAIWHVVKSGMATLTEIDNEWTMNDVNKAIAVLDFDTAVSESEDK